MKESWGTVQAFLDWNVASQDEQVHKRPSHQTVASRRSVVGHNEALYSGSVSFSGSCPGPCVSVGVQQR